MDTLNDLTFFSGLMRAGSMARLAQEIGVTPSTVTKRLAALEQRLGARLIQRTTRRMSLTQEGELFLREAERIQRDIVVLEQAIAGSTAQPKGLLRVHATLGFGRQHLAPAIVRFQTQHPEVSVQLTLSDSAINMVGDGFDVAVHIGALPDARVSMRRLVPNRRVLCASPAYLAAHPAPLKPADLASHQCIVIRQSDETYGSWTLTTNGRHDTIKVGGDLSTNDGEVALGWALVGRGILLRSTWSAAAYFQSGTLVPVLPRWAAPDADIVALYPTKQHLPAKTRAFVDFLVTHFADRAF